MPKGKEHAPKIQVETKLTAVSMSFNGRKISTFLNLPVIKDKVILPAATKEQIENDLGVERGDTISIG